MKQYIKNNALAIVLFGLFALFLAGLAITGYAQNNEELESHGQAAVTIGQYLTSGTFIEAVFENWESEFLQMGALVVLTIFLKQKGSADSKRLHGSEPEDAKPRYTMRGATTWKQRRKALGSLLYSNSLSLALFGLFAISFVLHAAGGASAHNAEAAFHGEQSVSILAYVATTQFWFESFQNWQSEFLAVAALIVLSIFLRQRGSPESKPVSDANATTGD